jgi:MFS family permease
VEELYKAVMSGHYALASAMALVLAVALVHRFASSESKWLGWTHTSWGAPLLVLLGSFGGALATSIGAGAAPSWAMCKVAFGLAVAAAGGWKLAKELMLPLLRKLQSKLGPAGRVLDVVLWVIDRKSLAVTAAEAAGDAAVKATPPNGIEGVVGKAREVK